MCAALARNLQKEVKNVRVRDITSVFFCLLCTQIRVRADSKGYRIPFNPFNV